MQSIVTSAVAAPLPGASTSREGIPPILRWAGSKAQLVETIECMQPRQYHRFIEPFAGSAALFFHLKPAHAILADLNIELINFYEILRDAPSKLLRLIETEFFFSDEQYYHVRAIRPGSLDPARRAARFYFLNRYCWNGLYRVNRLGQFNVPVGRFRTIPSLFNKRQMLNASAALQKHTLARQDAFKTTQLAEPNDFVYLDPPYHVERDSNGFQEYDDDGFSADSQRHLADEATRLAKRGVFVIVSNSDTNLIRSIYSREHFDYKFVEVKRKINSRADRRRHAVRELLISSCNIQK